MKIIGVTGGKGGTGKSTVSTALAIELAKDAKVLLVDLDVDCPNDHLILNISREKIGNVHQRVPEIDSEKCISCGKCSEACVTNALVSLKERPPIFIPLQCNGCGACEIVCPVNAISWSNKEIGTIFKGKKLNVDFLSGELKINEPVSEFVVDGVKKELEKQKNNYDFVIVDTAAGTHCDVISALRICDFTFVVTEPTPLGGHDLKLILGLVEKLGIDSKVILNRAGEGEEKIILKILEKFNKKISVKIPYSKEIMRSYAKGEPIVHESIKKIAELVK